MSARRYRRRLARSDFNWRRLFDFRSAEERGVALVRFDPAFAAFQERMLQEKQNPFDQMRKALNQ